MSDQELIATLKEKGLTVPPQEAGVSYAMALMMEQNCGLSEEGDLEFPDESEVKLKSLNELYVETKGVSKDDEQMALSMAMEFAIAFYDHTHDHGLNDADTIRMLEKLSMKPENALEGVGGLVQSHLRLELSLGDYSRGDVRQAVRRIQRSAQRQSKEGPRGYLSYIHHLMH